MEHVANEAQARQWNGDVGDRWLAQRQRHAAVRRRLTPRLLRAAAIAPGDRVLDVGCGCGETAVAAARDSTPGGVVRALDLSARLLAAARRLAAETGVVNIEFIQGDAQTYPLPPAAHDVVISGFGVMFFDDPLAAFANLAATLRPDGRLAFLCWQPEERNEVFSLPPRAFATQLKSPVPGVDGPFADPVWVSDLLTEAGFTDCRITALREPARIGADVDDVLAYVRQTSRVRELAARYPDDAFLRRVWDTLAGEYATRQRPDGVWVEAAAWLVVAARRSSHDSEE